MSQPTLTSLDHQGYAEQVRLMFAETGIKFNDKIVDEKAADQLLTSGRLPFGDLPMLTWEDFDLYDSAAIMEHVAVKADESSAGRGNSYLGDNEDERSYARSLVHGANELRRLLYEQVVRPGPKFNKDGFVSSVLPKWFQRLNHLAVETEANDLGLGPSKNFTFGDIAMFECLNQVVEALGDNVLDDYRELKSYYDRCARRPRFRMYLSNRDKRSLV